MDGVDMDWTSLDSGKMVADATNNTRKAGYGGHGISRSAE